MRKTSAATSGRTALTVTFELERAIVHIPVEKTFFGFGASLARAFSSACFFCALVNLHAQAICQRVVALKGEWSP